MGDLFTRRIGHGRAALLLRDVVARQKGGWMVKDLRAWVARRKRS
jgi:gamma-polyglutamate synthase